MYAFQVVAEFTAKKGMCPVGVTMAIVEALARAKHHTFIPEVTYHRFIIN
jgi:hypothetical protein